MTRNRVSKREPLKNRTFRFLMLVPVHFNCRLSKNDSQHNLKRAFLSKLSCLQRKHRKIESLNFELF